MQINLLLNLVKPRTFLLRQYRSQQLLLNWGTSSATPEYFLKLFSTRYALHIV